MNQTIAILVDAYRELNARKMFWITLIISALFMAIFALLGATDDTLSFATYEWPMANAKTVYKSILQVALVTVWLTWAAVILAIISTASIFPDFMASGSIDLYLAKPISRPRLFLTKYVAALLFVLLQATVFSIGAFFVVGLRAGEWKPSLFLAIPLITIFYSYLYAICVLLGVWTRSAIASMLLTILVWIAVFGVHFAESWTLSNLTTAQAYIEIQQQRIADADERIARAAASPAEPDSPGSAQPAGDDVQPAASAPAVAATERAVADVPETPAGADSGPLSVGALRQARSEAQAEVQRKQASLPSLQRWHTAFFAVMTVLPKTSETVGLLDRELFEPGEEEKLMTEAMERRSGRRARIGDDPFTTQISASIEGSRRASAETRSRSPVWVIGTSLVFEAVVLGIAGWIFCRRDY